MRGLIIISFLATSAFGQSGKQLLTERKYSFEYVKKMAKESKSSAGGTKRIIKEISIAYDGEAEQKELIEFYKDTYDGVFVDKGVLENLIDSLIQYGLNKEIRTLAIESKNSIAYRLLTKKMRDLKFPDKTGNQISLSSLNDKIVIVELWATWCGPCIKEMTRIPELRRSHPNIEFYSISLDKTTDQMKRFVEKKKYDWPIVLGGDAESNKELWEYLNIVHIPKYYTVDREGIVINVADKLDEQFIKSLK